MAVSGLHSLPSLMYRAKGKGAPDASSLAWVAQQEMDLLDKLTLLRIPLRFQKGHGSLFRSVSSGRITL